MTVSHDCSLDDGSVEVEAAMRSTVPGSRRCFFVSSDEPDPPPPLPPDPAPPYCRAAAGLWAGVIAVAEVDLPGAPTSPSTPIRQ